MKFALLDTVVLNRDLPEHGLRAGDLGAVVELYGTDGVEVDFVQASGQTKARLTLRPADLRSVAQSDILAVRSA
jgi:chitinase